MNRDKTILVNQYMRHTNQKYKRNSYIPNDFSTNAKIDGYKQKLKQLIKNQADKNDIGIGPTKK